MMERDPPRVARPRPVSASVSESDSASGRWRGHSRRGGRPRRRITTAHDVFELVPEPDSSWSRMTGAPPVRHGKKAVVQEMPLHTAFAVRKGRVGVGCSAACGLLAPRGRSGASPRDPREDRRPRARRRSRRDHHSAAGPSPVFASAASAVAAASRRHDTLSKARLGPPYAESAVTCTRAAARPGGALSRRGA
jgi:hypothetical protein